MKNHWHEQIQRYVNGQASADEIAALQAALHADAELRAWYLDYMNLDVALGAVADAAIFAEDATGRHATVAFPRPRARLAPHSWHWLAATAACAAVVIVVVLSQRRDTPRAQPDLAVVTAATHTAISQFRADVPPDLPAWMSPTASLLDQPAFPK
jgi:hypothetical protein